MKAVKKGYFGEKYGQGVSTFLKGLAKAHFELHFEKLTPFWEVNSVFAYLFIFICKYVSTIALVYHLSNTNNLQKNQQSIE